MVEYQLDLGELGGIAQPSVIRDDAAAVVPSSTLVPKQGGDCMNNAPESTSTWDPADDFWHSVDLPVEPSSLAEDCGLPTCVEPISVRVVSVNVNTLSPQEEVRAGVASSRRFEFADAFHRNGFLLIGIQESKCREVKTAAAGHT